MASKVILGLGLVFELPVLIMVLARFGIVTASSCSSTSASRC